MFAPRNRGKLVAFLVQGSCTSVNQISFYFLIQMQNESTRRTVQ
jgi:hypothetical protein